MVQAVHAPRVRPLVATTLLALLMLGAVPSGSGQITIYASHEGWTFGWLFPEGDVPGAVLDDAADDVAVSAADNAIADAPAGPLTGLLDIRRLEVLEAGDDKLLLRITLADIDPEAYTRENMLDTPGLAVHFTISGHAYRVNGYFFPMCTDAQGVLCEGFTSTDLVFESYLFEKGIDDEWQDVGTAPSRVLPDEARIDVIVPRWALARGATERYPMAGEVITEVRAETSKGYGITLSDSEVGYTVSDAVPDAAPAAALYVLQKDSAGSVVTVGLPAEKGEAERPEEGPYHYDDGVEPLGPRVEEMDRDLTRTTRIPIELSNRLSRSALAVPTAHVVSEHEAKLRLPANINVPSGETRRFDIVVDATGPFDPAAPLLIDVAISTVGTPRPYVDHLTLSLRSLPELGPEAPRLYLHTYTIQTFPLAEQTTHALVYSDGALNTLEQDPADNGNGAPLSDYCICMDYVPSWNTQGGLAADRYLDALAGGVFHLALDAPVAGAADVDVTVGYGDDPVGRAAHSFDIAQGQQEIDVPLVVPDQAAELAASKGRFTLRIQALFRPGADVPFAELSNFAEATVPRLRTGGASWIELPFVEGLPRHSSAEHLVVDLARGYEGVQYVNPGRSTLWNVTILNQGETTDTIRIAAVADAEGWTVRVAPGSRFTIGPGESVTLGLTARAPQAAQEAETTRVNVTASSSNQEGASSGLTVTAVATAGVRIDEGHYVPDNDTAARLVAKERKKDTAGPVLPIVVGALAALVAAARRRTA